MYGRVLRKISMTLSTINAVDIKIYLFPVVCSVMDNIIVYNHISKQYG